MLASFSDIPLSPANAFEKPVSHREGFLKPSVERLIRYWHTLQQGYGLDDAAKLFCVVDHTEKIEYQVPTLKALQTWVQAAHGNEE